MLTFEKLLTFMLTFENSRGGSQGTPPLYETLVAGMSIDYVIGIGNGIT